MTTGETELRLERATLADCRALAATSKSAFDSDVAFGAPGAGGPPGYDSPSWYQGAFRHGRVFRLVYGGEVVGGAIVIPKGRFWCELGRIWLTPTLHGRGLGKQAMALVEAEFPQVSRWTLDTPLWNSRTRRFYAGLGYREIRQDREFVYLEKRVSISATKT